MRRVVVALMVLGSLLVASAGPAQAQIHGKARTAWWLAAGEDDSGEAVGPECTIHYQAVAYPGSSTRTVNLNGEFNCAPIGIYHVNVLVVAHDGQGQNLTPVMQFKCTGPTDEGSPIGCARPNRPVSFGGSVQVPNGILVTWDMFRVDLILPPDEDDLDLPEATMAVDPWVLAPFPQGCTIGTRLSTCHRPFSAHDPEDLVGNELNEL